MATKRESPQYQAAARAFKEQADIVKSLTLIKMSNLKFHAKENDPTLDERLLEKEMKGFAESLQRAADETMKDLGRGPVDFSEGYEGEDEDMPSDEQFQELFELDIEHYTVVNAFEHMVQATMHALRAMHLGGGLGPSVKSMFNSQYGMTSFMESMRESFFIKQLGDFISRFEELLASLELDNHIPVILGIALTKAL